MTLAMRLLPLGLVLSGCTSWEAMHDPQFSPMSMVFLFLAAFVGYAAAKTTMPMARMGWEFGAPVLILVFLTVNFGWLEYYSAIIAKFANY